MDKQDSAASDALGSAEDATPDTLHADMREVMLSHLSNAPALTDEPSVLVI
jgi:hypothetical protein